MNFTTNNNDTPTVFTGALFFQQFQQRLSFSQIKASTQKSARSQHRSHKPLSCFQIIEICFLCLILVEHTTIFILTFRKKSPKRSLFDTNEQRQSQQHRSVILRSKSLLYNCLHRNWIRAYSFSNMCLAVVYFLILIVKHRYPNLLHYTSITYYSLPLTLVQQILINFSTFHLFIMSISILQYFIRYYRLFKDKYSLNSYSGKTLLITKHTNIALILSGSLALIFAYNFIFYTPKYPQTISLLPLITLNMVLLPLMDFLIFVFFIICFIITLYKYKTLIKHDLSFDNQQQQPQQQQHLTNDVRLTIEKNTCIKCYSKFLRQNPNLFQDSDPYTRLHRNFFSHNLLSSARPSLTPSDEKRKYSTASYENIPMMNDAHSRLRGSYPCHTTRNSLLTKSNRSQQDLSIEPQTDLGRNSANELLLQTTLLKLKHQRSLCHLCYRLLLLFLLKYALFTFPQHLIQMLTHLRHFYEYILKHNSSNNNNNNLNNNNHPHHPSSPRNNSNILSEHNEITSTICRYLFLIARFGDSLLLTRLPNLIKKYFPCWCQFNSKLLRKQTTYQRPSHQILMNNAESSTNEPLSATEFSNSNDIPNRQESQRRRQVYRTKHRRFRLRFQFVPIWSNNRLMLSKENC